MRKNYPSQRQRGSGRHSRIDETPDLGQEEEALAEATLDIEGRPRRRHVFFSALVFSALVGIAGWPASPRR